MTSCSIYRDQLADAALGERISDQLTMHLRDCHGCRVELELQRAIAQRMDAVVNQLVREQPPWQLLPSTLASVRRVKRPLPWTRAWPAAIGTALAASIIGVTIGVREIHPAATLGTDAARLAAWHSPTGALLQPRDSVLQTPLRDVWFDPKPKTLHSQHTPGGTYGA
jgi:hypothetical protein